MNAAPEPERDPSPAPYLRLPMPLVAGALFIFLAGLLALGLYANQNLRPQGILVPTPVVQAAPSETPPAVAAVVSTATPATVVAVTAPTPLVLIIASPTAAPLVSSLAPTATPVAAAATQIATPLPTVEPTLAAEVGKAYENFWRVKSQALVNLDSTHLVEVMDGDYLATTTSLIEELRSEGRAIKTQVSLDYTVVQADPASAAVVDFFVDNSVYVRIGTGDPLSTPMADELSVLYRLRKLDQVWKVVESARAP